MLVEEKQPNYPNLLSSLSVPLNNIKGSQPSDPAACHGRTTSERNSGIIFFLLGSGKVRALSYLFFFLPRPLHELPYLPGCSLQSPDHRGASGYRRDYEPVETLVCAASCARSSQGLRAKSKMIGIFSSTSVDSP